VPKSIKIITYMKPFYTKLTLMFSLLLCILPLQAQKNKFISLKPAEFKALIEQTAKPSIIDVRSSAVDFKAGHISGAIHLDPTDIHFISDVKRFCSDSDVIFIYCRIGKTSKQTAQLLVSRGFKNIYNLKGGLLAWEKSFPTVTE